MTELTGNAMVRRLSRAQYRGRQLVVEVSGHEITLREKGRRLKVPVPIVAVYDLGFKLLAREARAAKAAARGKR